MTIKKLLVLDVNGLLIDTYFHKEPLPEESPDARVGNFFVYKRPFCEEFLQFCLDNFIVGIWSSAREYNVNNLVEYVFGDAKERLAFSWHQSDCTDVGLKAPDNQWKPLFMKELSKLWSKVKMELPWSEGDYGPSNTLLVDDTPYKAVLNPPNTAIFPRSYTARDHGDTFLGGALRSYLEGIRDAASVQTYVENNPFGEPSITPESPLWSHISKVLLRVQNVLNEVSDEIAQILPVEAISDDIRGGDRRKRSRFRKQNGFSDPLQRTNDDTRPLVEFPSEAIELHNNEDMVHQIHEVGLSGKQILGLAGPLEADMEQSKNEQPGLERSHVDCGRNDGDNRMIRGASESSQEELQGTVEGAIWTLEGQACIAEQTFFNSDHTQSNASARIDVELDDIRKQRCDEGKEENGQKGCGDSSFDVLESNLMHVEGSDEQCCIAKELVTPREDNFVPTSNDWEEPLDSLTCSDGSRVKHRRFHGWPPIETHGKRKFSHRDGSDCNQSWKRRKGFYRDNNSMDYNQSWKRQNGLHRDDNRHDSDYAHNWRGGSVWYENNNKDSLGNDHNWKRQRRGGATNMLPFSGRDQKRPFQNKHLNYEADRGYVNRDGSFSSSYVRPSQQRHSDRPVDVPTENMWAAPRVSTTRNAVLDRDFPAKPYQSSGGFHAPTTNSNVYGHAQNGITSGDWWHQDFEPNDFNEGSSVWPARTEDWSRKSWHNDWANRKSGATSEPYRDVGASSWKYRRGIGASRPSHQSTGASRPSHQSTGASMQWHYSYRNRRAGW